MEPYWTTAFLDFAPADHAVGTAFWSAATGYPISRSRGRDDEFASLRPPSGGVYLKVQRLGDRVNRIHLDFHVGDVQAAADRALSLGAAELARNDGWSVLQSPAGIIFCFVDHPVSGVALPTVWPDGHSSIADQISLDIPPDSFEDECEFWAAITYRPLGQSRWFAEFRNLERPPNQRIRFLLQRLDDGAAGAHIDFATNDRAAETARHIALGASVEKVKDRWTVLHDPTGRRYCITDRDPG